MWRILYLRNEGEVPEQEGIKKMTIHTEPLDQKIGGLPAFRVIGWSKKLLMKEFEIPVKDAIWIWEATMESEMVDTLHTYTGSVG